jgi:hypothetical protein
MKYRNIKTGQIIDIRSELKSDKWEPIEAEPVKVPEKKSSKKPKK